MSVDAYARVRSMSLAAAVLKLGFHYVPLFSNHLEMKWSTSDSVQGSCAEHSKVAAYYSLSTFLRSMLCLNVITVWRSNCKYFQTSFLPPVSFIRYKLFDATRNMSYVQLWQLNDRFLKYSWANLKLSLYQKYQFCMVLFAWHSFIISGYVLLLSNKSFNLYLILQHRQSLLIVSF